MSHKFKTLPSNTSSQIPSSRASLPVLNGRRRLINRPAQQLSNNSNNNAEEQFNSPSPLHQVTTGFTPLSPHIPIAPPTPYSKKSASDLQRSSSPANLLTTSQETANCLKGVTAYLDVRTEDGDDVSQNFENALKSMGAKTRKTFADNVTHLIFKNGSAHNVKKALNNKCKIVNLLWITNCKSEGRRLPEDKYLIDHPENLVLTGAKRRKSMEPGRVKALVLDHSSSLEDKRSENAASSKRLKSPATTRSKPSTSQKRKTVSHWETSAIIPREITNSHHSAAQKSDMSLDNLDFDFGDSYETPSSPTSERLQRHNNHAGTGQGSLPSTISRSMRRLSFKEEPSERPPPISQKPQVNKEIKAGFYIGKAQNSSSASSSSALSSSPTSTTLAATPSSSSSSLSASLPSLSSTSPVLIRRRRRSLSNRTALASPSTGSTTSRLSIGPDKSKSSPLSSPFLKPQPAQNAALAYDDDDDVSNRNPRFPTIVMTSMSEPVKKKCANVIKKLGKYRLASSVDESTTHVIIGCQRRTQSVILGLLYGTWLVTSDWLLDSDKSNEYLAEAGYEAIIYFPRARAARRRDPLLPSTINIYIHSTHLSMDLAQLLVTKAGGQLVDSMKDADIVISNSPLDSNVITVSEDWLLDSIQHWRYLATNRYQLSSA